MMSLKPWLAPVVTLAVMACTSAEGAWKGTVTDSAGVTIVTNTDEGVWTPQTRWTLEEDLRIGTIEGAPEYQFGQIGFIAVDSKQRVFVMDAQARHIRVFSQTGTYEQTIGGPGAGPGELGTQAITLYMAPGDTLLVPDLANQRVNRYAPDGTSIGSFPLRLENGIPMAINATRTGVIAEQVRPLSLPDLPAKDSMDVIVTLATDGTIRDTLMTFRPGGTLDFGGSEPRMTLFSPEPVWQLSDDMRLYFGISDDYRISVHAPDGSLERIISKPFSRDPVTERDQNLVREFFEEQVRDNVPPAAQEQALAQFRQMIHFAEFYPAFASVQMGPQGSIWVQHIQSPSTLSEEELASWNLVEDIGSRDWDVFDSEGRFLGVMTMPPRFAPRIIFDDEIYGVWRDELDVQYVVRLTIQGLGGAE
ncbi:MAG: 6-bladed beta-propeller [Gemmatimonadota bacterium]|nr:6-bladed beta-propeller [Gemmatimonadota bacterium]